MRPRDVATSPPELNTSDLSGSISMCRIRDPQLQNEGGGARPTAPVPPWDFVTHEHDLE
jgi:hypothetical protein